MKRSFYKRLILIAVCAFAVLPGCGAFGVSSGTPAPAAGADEMTVLCIGTADAGGTMYPAGDAIAEAISAADPAITGNVSASGGSSDNIKGISSGQFDLGGRSCSIGPAGSSTDLSARAALQSLGILGEVTAKNISIANGCDLLRQSKIDAAYGFAGTPIRGMAALTEDMPCRVLQYSPQELQQIQR